MLDFQDYFPEQYQEYPEPEADPGQEFGDFIHQFYQWLPCTPQIYILSALGYFAHSCTVLYPLL